MSESKLGQGYYYIVVIHLTNSLKGNLHQVNEFPRDVSDIDYKYRRLRKKPCIDTNNIIYMQNLV